MSDSRQDRPAVLEGRAEWTSRPAGLSAATPERLASLVDGAIERCDRTLFTITPREELVTSAKWQRLADQAWCGQLRHVVACTARMSGSNRDFAGDDLALALGISPLTGRALVWEYGAIASLPGLVEAVEEGRMTARHVQAVMRVLEQSGLSLEQRQAVALIALARFVDQTPSQWADLVGRLIVTIDPAAAARRRDEKTAGRHARFYPQPDEQGAMWLQAPAEQLARAQARLAAEATRLKAAGDERSTDQLVCDVALALLADGRLDGQDPAGFDVHVIVPMAILDDDAAGVREAGDEETAEGADPADHADAAERTEATGAGSADHDLELAEIPGWGVILPDTARRLAGQAAGFTQIGVDDDGAVVSVGDRVRADTLRKTNKAGRACPLPPAPDRFLHQAAQAMRMPPVERDLTSPSYRPGGRLGRRLRARDRTCVFPGCRTLATRTDLDHRIPWPRGSTSVENLQCLCRHHHRAKHAIFTVLADADGTIVWITRGGWIFRRRPHRYRRPQGD